MHDRWVRNREEMLTISRKEEFNKEILTPTGAMTKQGWTKYGPTFFTIVWPCIVTDSLWVKPTDALNSIFIGITTLHVSGSLSAHHEESWFVHRLWYIICSCDRLLPGVGWNCAPSYSWYVEIKSQLDATDDFYCRSFCLLNTFRAPLFPIIRSSRVLYKWLLPVVFSALVFKLSVWCGAEGQNHIKSTPGSWEISVVQLLTEWLSKYMHEHNQLM